ncbi:MAG: diguanylate cyclase domain-containing protein [Candidatus Limnocylindrales bacterium]
MAAERDQVPVDAAPTVPLIEEAEPAPLVPIGPSFLPAPPTGWSDTITGTDGPRFWDRMISTEGARSRRYGRPITVAFAEFVGLDRLSRQWGPDVGERALILAARTLGKEIRSSDHIARLEEVRFGILLTETTEIAAINFIERARASCERELAAADVVQVAFGWASPAPKSELTEAVTIALERLAAEVRDLQ